MRKNLCDNLCLLSYIHSHLLLAETHYQLGEWIDCYDEIKKSNKKEKEEINKQLASLIGKEEINDLDRIGNLERALNHYYKAIEMHTEGDAYQNIIQDMYYLDDNFNDNLYHFSATMDRIKINTGEVADKISELEKILKHTTIINLVTSLSRRRMKMRSLHSVSAKTGK